MRRVLVMSAAAITRHVTWNCTRTGNLLAGQGCLMARMAASAAACKLLRVVRGAAALMTSACSTLQQGYRRKSFRRPTPGIRRTSIAYWVEIIVA